MAQVLVNLLVQIVLGLVLKLLLNGFPLVDGNQDGSALLHNIADQLEVLDFKGRKSIHDIHYHMALLHLHHRAHLSLLNVLLLCLLQLVVIQTCRINELYFSALVHYFRRNTIPRGVRSVRNHHSVHTQNFVDQ